MIIETLVTSLNSDGTANIAPMGPVVEQGWERFELRPFMETTTYANLVRTKQGVLHLSDNPLWFASAVVDCWPERPEMVSAETVSGWRLADAQQAFEFEVTHILTEPPRATLQCRTLRRSPMLPWSGLCRATHAILECAIAATRIQFLPAAEIQAVFTRGQVLVAKTGGPREQQAWSLLVAHLEKQGFTLEGNAALPI